MPRPWVPVGTPGWAPTARNLALARTIPPRNPGLINGPTLLPALKWVALHLVLCWNPPVRSTPDRTSRHILVVLVRFISRLTLLSFGLQALKVPGKALSTFTSPALKLALGVTWQVALTPEKN